MAVPKLMRALSCIRGQSSSSCSDPRGKSTSSNIPIRHLIIGVLCWLIVFPLLLIFLVIPFTLLRLSHLLLAKIFHPELIPLDGDILDLLFITRPSTEYTMMNASHVWRIQGKVQLETFRQHFHFLFLSNEELGRKYRNLYCYYVKWGLYCFKKAVPTIDLNDKIKSMEMDSSMQEDEFIGSWMSTNDYGNGPQWEILLVHLENKDETLLLFKIDHGLIDGYTMIHLIEKLTGTVQPYMVKEHDYSFFTKLKLILICLPAMILEWPWNMRSTQPLPITAHPLSSSSTSTSPILQEKWMISFTTLPLASIRKIRRLTSTHFSSVLAALQVGALRRYCLESGISSYSTLPAHCNIVIPLARPKHPAMIHGGMCNHATYNFQKVLFQEPDPMKRIMGAEAEYLYETTTLGLPTTFYWILLRFLWQFPPFIILSILSFAERSKSCNAEQLLSPLMCSESDHYLFGNHQHIVKHIYLPVHVPHLIRLTRFYMVPVSNGGKLDISINATNKFFKSQKELDWFTKVLLHEELQHLISSVDKIHGEVHNDNEHHGDDHALSLINPIHDC